MLVASEVLYDGPNTGMGHGATLRSEDVTVQWIVQLQEKCGHQLCGILLVGGSARTCAGVHVGVHIDIEIDIVGCQWRLLAVICGVGQVGGQSSHERI